MGTASAKPAPLRYVRAGQGEVTRQIDVAADVAAQIAAGDTRITGIMIESHLFEGRQDIQPGHPLMRGVSVTDACIGWDDSVALLQGLAQAVKARRAKGA